MSNKKTDQFSQGRLSVVTLRSFLDAELIILTITWRLFEKWQALSKITWHEPVSLHPSTVKLLNRIT